MASKCYLSPITLQKNSLLTLIFSLKVINSKILIFYNSLFADEIFTYYSCEEEIDIWSEMMFQSEFLTWEPVWWRCWCDRKQLDPAALWNTPQSALQENRCIQTQQRLIFSQTSKYFTRNSRRCFSLSWRSNTRSRHNVSVPVALWILQVDQQGGDNLLHVSRLPDVHLQLVVHRLPDHALQAADPRHTDPEGHDLNLYSRLCLNRLIRCNAAAQENNDVFGAIIILRII